MSELAAEKRDQVSRSGVSLIMLALTSLFFVTILSYLSIVYLRNSAYLGGEYYKYVVSAVGEIFLPVLGSAIGVTLSQLGGTKKIDRKVARLCYMIFGIFSIVLVFVIIIFMASVNFTTSGHKSAFQSAMETIRLILAGFSVVLLAPLNFVLGR